MTATSVDVEQGVNEIKWGSRLEAKPRVDDGNGAQDSEREWGSIVFQDDDEA